MDDFFEGEVFSRRASRLLDDANKSSSIVFCRDFSLSHFNLSFNSFRVFNSSGFFMDIQYKILDNVSPLAVPQQAPVA